MTYFIVNLINALKYLFNFELDEESNSVIYSI